ncbi:hypothetical protein [Schlesneria sp. DSM 10557]
MIEACSLADIHCLFSYIGNRNPRQGVKEEILIILALSRLPQQA